MTHLGTTSIFIGTGQHGVGVGGGAMVTAAVSMNPGHHGVICPAPVMPALLITTL